MIISIIVLLQVMGIKSMMTPPEGIDPETGEVVAVPLAQLEEFNMDDNFIMQFPSLENEGKTVNVVLKIGFAIDTENKGFEDAKLALTGQGKIIRDRIQKVFNSKDSTTFKDLAKQDTLKLEILELVRTLIGNDAVTEVYFIAPIVSEK